MWCILCCQTQSNEEDKRLASDPQNKLETEKRVSSEQCALILPLNSKDIYSKQPLEINNCNSAKPATITKKVDDPVQTGTHQPQPRLAHSEQTNQMQLFDTKHTTHPVEPSLNSDRSRVSPNISAERELKQRLFNPSSPTNRPVWTLKDVLDSPYDSGSNATSTPPPDLIDSMTSTQNTIVPSKTEPELSLNPTLAALDEDEGKQPAREGILIRRHTRPGSMRHHAAHTTFFLPRISTDPTTGQNSLDRSSSTSDGKSFPIRRGSMIVRSGRTTTASSGSIQPSNTDSALTGPGIGVEGFIVTPFAQVLVSMQRIRSAFIRLTATQSNNRFGVNSSAVSEPGIADILVPETQEYKLVASETLEELEWCLKQLENIETKRPVSDMAFSKFKRLLNKELNSFGEADKSRHEISAYICGTFLEDEKDAQVSQEIEQMMERRRSSGQSHGSGGMAANEAAGANNTSGSKSQSHQRSSLLTPESGSTKLAESESPTGPHVAQLTDGNVTPNANKHECPSSDNQNSRTVNSELSLPMHGIDTTNNEELEDRFSQYLDTWGLDIFEIDRLSDGHALTTTTYRIFKNRDLMRIFSIDPATLVRYLLKLEQNYHIDVPYHNALHAADVIQTSHFLLQAEPLEDVFSDLEILAVLFASAVHDVDHPGLTNQFLINTGHDLALQYNDTSVLENHHLYVAFKLLNDPDCDVFAALAAKKRQSLRRMIIELVLATDMSKHMSLLADLRTMVETKKVSGSGVLNLDNYSDRIQILQNMIHCADLSNPAKPLRLNRKWTSRLMEEFFRQGDKERMLKLEISPMCDRESVAIEKSQVSFIDFVAHPLLESWCDLVHPSAQLILDTLADNRDWYESQTEDPRPSSVTKCRPKLATAEEDEEEQAVSS